MANLVLQTDKVHLLHKEAGFLGHIVSEKGVEPDPRKVEAISNWPRPTNVKQIRQYLGTTGYYRRFIKDYARIASPLSNLTKKNKPFEWTEECETSFLTLKQHLCKAPILQFPDMNQKFTLTTDASDYAIGAVLSQTVDGNDLPVSYLSRSLNKHEINYTTTEKECLAALYAMSIYRPYLLGRKFTLQSDHEPLNWMHSRKDPGPRLMRWMFKFVGLRLRLQIQTRKGKCSSRWTIQESTRKRLEPKSSKPQKMNQGESKVSHHYGGQGLPADGSIVQRNHDNREIKLLQVTNSTTERKTQKTMQIEYIPTAQNKEQPEDPGEPSAKKPRKHSPA
ncbi:unnamed protein product, partial [Trichogramma brassicae]